MLETSSIPGNRLLALVGHTAAGKTALAARIAHALGGEVISADSRQVYRGMDIGTGKDLGDYRVDGQIVPYHLVDVADAGTRYTLYDFYRDFIRVYEDLERRRKLPVLCGGTGLYLEAVIRGYHLAEAPVDPEFREQAAGMSDVELIRLLESYVALHNVTDTCDRERLLRAIEVARANRVEGVEPLGSPVAPSVVFGLAYDAETRRSRITRRLRERLDGGMIAEVETLLNSVSPDNLMYYGLEYKYLTLYCTGKLSYDEMFRQLNIAIHQFAKRQMTWFRGMERRGTSITWIPQDLSDEDKLAFVLERFR